MIVRKTGSHSSGACPEIPLRRRGSAGSELIAIRGPVGAPRPSGHCRGSNRGPHDGNIGETLLLPSWQTISTIARCRYAIFRPKPIPRPRAARKGRTYGSRMGSAKKESILDRGVVPHMGIPLPYTRLNPSTRPSMLNVISWSDSKPFPLDRKFSAPSRPAGG
jgi:hypothetical protein